jgi:hypothetical protein
MKTTKKEQNLPDEQNPIYTFSCIHTDILAKAMKGEIDLFTLAKKELQNRGLNNDGLWVGFKQTKLLTPNQIKAKESLIREIKVLQNHLSKLL